MCNLMALLFWSSRLSKASISVLIETIAVQNGWQKFSKHFNLEQIDTDKLQIYFKACEIVRTLKTDF